MIFEEIESNGGQIVSVSENIDNSLTGKLIRSILAWSAQWSAKRSWSMPTAIGRPGWSTTYRSAPAAHRTAGLGAMPTKPGTTINHEEAAVRFSVFHMFVTLDMSRARHRP